MTQAIDTKYIVTSPTESIFRLGVKVLENFNKLYSVVVS